MRTPMRGRSGVQRPRRTPIWRAGLLRDGRVISLITSSENGTYLLAHRSRYPSGKLAQFGGSVCLAQNHESPRLSSCLSRFQNPTGIRRSWMHYAIWTTLSPCSTSSRPCQQNRLMPSLQKLSTPPDDCPWSGSPTSSGHMHCARCLSV